MSYTTLFSNECLKAKRLIEKKLGRLMSEIEFRAITRLSSLTFLEMMMLDFETNESPTETEQTLKNLIRSAEDRFQIAIEELSVKMEDAFGVGIDGDLSRLLRSRGNGIDLLNIQEEVNEHKAVLPKFVRKRRVKNTLENWEDRLRKRR